MATNSNEKSANPIVQGGVYALAAALAFGVTTPFIQRFGRGVGPIPSAALLYAGAALVSLRGSQRGDEHEAPVRRTHAARLVVVALVGAVVAPVSLTWGLQHTTATSASFLLNFEAFFTVVLASLLYREPVGRRVIIALIAMALGGLCVVAGSVSGPAGFGAGALAVTLATLAWAVDNTLTRPLADLNPAQVVRWKGTLGAGMSVVLSFVVHQPFPRWTAAVGFLACGATGYGLSLRWYLLAQRHLGAARSGSIFALAPFVGVGAAWVLGDRSANLITTLGGLLFGFGIYLHLTETHRHVHTHSPLEHEHAHRHDDAHHDHPHDFSVKEEHSHVHRHDVRAHDHAHAPDVHHEHGHDDE